MFHIPPHSSSSLEPYSASPAAAADGSWGSSRWLKTRISLQSLIHIVVFLIFYIKKPAIHSFVVTNPSTSSITCCCLLHQMNTARQTHSHTRSMPLTDGISIHIHIYARLMIFLHSKQKKIYLLFLTSLRKKHVAGREDE